MDSNRSSGNIRCPICHMLGYVNLREGKYVRVTHNYPWVRHCYLGRPDKALWKLEKVAAELPDKVDPVLIESLKKYVKPPDLPDQDWYVSSEVLELAEQVRQLSYKFSDSVEHKIRIEDRCPHCKKKVAIYLTRVGGRKWYHVKGVWLDTWKIY